ncbi:MAG: hypothetical protein EP335_01865 [Alphaproteobacteria bacterium]|nr:MAG: hypothetical protein EP335_01865 [Alphaproteobacteria bacterium]
MTSGTSARMGKDVRNVEQMVDYVNQLRRHTEGRRAVHIRLSALEREFQQEHYRLFCASTLRVLVTKFGATIFSLPNADIVVITREAAVDNIDPPLTVIRRKLKGSSVIARLDPIQGVSDSFIEWFDLETQYADFRRYIAALADRLLGLSGPDRPVPTVTATVAEPAPAKQAKRGFDEDTEALLVEIQQRIGKQEQMPQPKLSPMKAVRMIPIVPPNQEISDHELNPELLVTLVNALHGTDIAGLIRRQRVMAILGDEVPMEVFVHKIVPQSLVFETVFKNRVLAPNRWLSGYLNDYVASRVLASLPSMDAEKSLASSLRVTTTSVLSEAFDTFDEYVGERSRARIILEFTALDMMANPRLYMAAARKASDRGYRISVADIDPASFVWLDQDRLDAAFVKVRKPNLAVSDWLTPELETVISHKINRVGMARAIFDGCDSRSDIELGERLGFTLFQGEAVDPLHAI